MPRVTLFAHLMERCASWVKLSFVCVLLACGTLYLLDQAFPLHLKKCNTLSFMVLDHRGELLSVQLSEDDKWRLPVDVETVNPLFLKLLVSYEDKRFYSHLGVDPLALLRSFWQLIKLHRVVSGGSTITMQTAKLLEPRPRTFQSKVIELLRAFQLEWHYSKKDILRLYLTLAPYGGNLEGLTAASFAYFGKPPKHLSLSEAAVLVMLPQMPSKLRPDLYPGRAKLYRDRVLKRLSESQDVLSKGDAIRVIDEKIVVHLRKFPNFAPHLSRFLKQVSKTNPCRTTLDSAIQKRAEAVLQAQVETFQPEQTAAVLIVDNSTSQIMAYVGSSSMHDPRKLGHVDMVRSVRSPGSTLKPMIYALAFDDRWLHPHTLINDIPTQFGSYAPSNFKDRFHGVVTIAEALQQSLNIPAVAVLEKLGPGHFVCKLENLGIKLHFPKFEQRFTLPIALGGVGIRLFDLVNLYSALANEGQYQSISWDPDHKQAKKHFIKPQAAQFITEILQSAPPPAGYMPTGITQSQSIAYKTGTSYGFRDAWSLGYTNNYTIGVWVGRADGTPIADQMGRQNAAPLLFKLFHSIEFALHHVQERKSLEQPLPRKLPTNLRFFKQKGSASETQNSLVVSFPPDNSTLMFDKDHPIALLIKGGVPPYTWYVNNVLFTKEQFHKEVLWQPESRGFNEITVVDQHGQTSTVHVRVLAD